MAKLTTAKRNKLSSKTFGMPASRKYPMPDRAHAANAKARATQMVEKGKLSPSSASKIKAKANKLLGETEMKHHSSHEGKKHHAAKNHAPKHHDSKHSAAKHDGHKSEHHHAMKAHHEHMKKLEHEIHEKHKEHKKARDHMHKLAKKAYK